jgi:hypothetical protein
VHGAEPRATLAAALAHSAAPIPGGGGPYKARRARIFIASELRDLEAAIATADDVVTAAGETVAQDVGGSAAFEAAAAPHIKTTGAPWLRKGRDGGDEIFKRVGDGRFDGRWVPASAEESAAGVHFADALEWRRQGGVAPLTSKDDTAEVTAMSPLALTGDQLSQVGHGTSNERPEDGQEQGRPPTCSNHSARAPRASAGRPLD